MQSSRAELERLSDIIGLIYEGATDPARWSKDIMPATTEYLRGSASALFTASRRPQDGGFCFVQGVPQDRVDLYINQYFMDNPWAQAAAEKGLINSGNVVLGNELLPLEQWHASRLFADCFGRLRALEQMMAGVIFGMESHDAMGTVFSSYRSLDEPAFGEDDRARMQLLLPHISRSIGVMQRLRAAELTVATTLAALDRLPSGVLLLDARGHVAFANRAAQHMLEQGDGLRLRQRPDASGLGRIDTDSAAGANAIDTAILATLRRDPYATPHFSQSVQVLRPSGRGSYTLQFSALGNHNEFGGGSSGYQAIVLLADSAHRPQVHPDVLRAAYGLTAAEATVAITLLEHDSAKEAAQVLGVSPDTVRTQLKQIYAKLGVDSRTRFVKLMLGLASINP